MWAKDLQELSEEYSGEYVKKWLSENILPSIEETALEGYDFILLTPSTLYGIYCISLVNKILREEGFEVTFKQEHTVNELIEISWRRK